MKKLYVEDELRRRSYYELYQIASNERLIENYIVNPNREQLINIILKYRGSRTTYAISEYNELGLPFVQELFDRKLSKELHHDFRIKIPHKIIVYKGMNLTKEDNYKIILPSHISNANVYLLNANSYICGILHLEKDPNSRDVYYLTSKQEFLRLEGLSNKRFSLVFFKDIDAKFPYNFYNAKNEEELKLYPFNLDYYKVDIENFEIRDLEKTSTTLCIDFGTSNTSAGCYIDQHYVSQLPNNDIINGNIKVNEINYTKFPSGEDEFKEIFPTVVYVENCYDAENIHYLFGYEALQKLESNNYILAGSIFYGLKKWVHEYNVEEKIVDELGNIRYVPRLEIIRSYLNYIVSRSEYQFKCKFRRIHASSPVKLKQQFLEMFQEVFTYSDEQDFNDNKSDEDVQRNNVDENRQNIDDKNEMSDVNLEIESTDEFSNDSKLEYNKIRQYEILKEDVMDEAIAVLYNTVEDLVSSGKFISNREYKALIIDCGGGTTDLAACRFSIDNGDVAYFLDVKTSFENGDENFGGNNLTYRIMQYLKIVLAKYYTFEKDFKLEDLMPYDSKLIYRDIDDYGVDFIYEKLIEEYKNAERIIPTKYAQFENKLSEEYRRIKNNFYFLWEVAETLKKEFFKRDNSLTTSFGSIRDHLELKDFHTTDIRSWNLNIIENNMFRLVSTYPDLRITIKELEKIVKADIYSMLKKFLNTYYEEGILQEYSLIKLSGQSTKIGVFQEVLKEFVPGKMIEYKTREMGIDNSYDLKLNCLNGAIKYLDYRRFGHIDVSIKNEIPLVPYSVQGEKYTGERVELLKTSRKANQNKGYIDKSSSAMELKLFLYNVDNELKKEVIFKNDLSAYDERDSEVIVSQVENRFGQDSTNGLLINNTRFFVYTDENNWGFFVWPVRRKSDQQLYLGKRQYYPFEDNLNEISFFDGEH